MPELFDEQSRHFVEKATPSCPVCRVDRHFFCNNHPSIVSLKHVVVLLGQEDFDDGLIAE